MRRFRLKGERNGCAGEIYEAVDKMIREPSCIKLLVFARARGAVLLAPAAAPM
jgi:hypothetical protein